MTDEEELDKLSSVISIIIDAIYLADLNYEQYIAALSCVIGTSEKYFEGITTDGLIADISSLAKRCDNADGNEANT